MTSGCLSWYTSHNMSMIMLNSFSKLLLTTKESWILLCMFSAQTKAIGMNSSQKWFKKLERRLMEMWHRIWNVTSVPLINLPWPCQLLSLWIASKNSSTTLFWWEDVELLTFIWEVIWKTGKKFRENFCFWDSLMLMESSKDMLTDCFQLLNNSLRLTKDILEFNFGTIFTMKGKILQMLSMFLPKFLMDGLSGSLPWMNKFSSRVMQKCLN